VQEQIPAWRGPVLDPDTGRLISSHVMNQDFVAWVGQGVIPDRTNEHLGTSDAGIIMMRQRFLKDIDAIARGEDPKATIRDPELNRCINLPIADRKNLIEGLTLDELAKHPLAGGQLSDYVFQAGQPREVRAAYAKAMGLAE
jgi:5,5'-dehydrodivanillate O-demethylase